MLDLAITGGTCVLPTGTQAADIGVKDGRIALVGGAGLAAGSGAHRVGHRTGWSSPAASTRTSIARCRCARRAGPTC